MSACAPSIWFLIMKIGVNGQKVPKRRYKINQKLIKYY